MWVLRNILLSESIAPKYNIYDIKIIAMDANNYSINFSKKIDEYYCYPFNL